MGYSSRVTGRIPVTPPLPLVAVTESNFSPESRMAREFMVDVKYEVAEETVGADAFRRVVVAIVANGEDGYSFYELEAHLILAVLEIEANGSVASGFLLRVGESQGDVERLRAEEGRVWSERAELRWSDGSPVGEV